MTPTARKMTQRARPSILVIEDEHTMRRLLRLLLEGQGYSVLEADCGEEGVRRAHEMDPALVLLDLGLPDIDGVDVAVRIRETSAAPILVLSVRSDEDDVVQALDSGANDFLTKPFREGELFARIRASLRESAERQLHSWTANGVQLRPAERAVMLGGREVRLSGTEFRLLAVLVKAGGAVVTHERLITAVWGRNRASEVGSLRVYMHHLREKIEADPARPRWLLTEPGVGYRLFVDPEATEA